MDVELEARDRAMLEGERGDGAALAMRLVVKMAEVARAPRLRDVVGAHIDSCLYHGRAGLDFAERLVAGGATVAVPSTLNVSSLDLLHPELVHLDEGTATDAKRLMDAYVAMGCRPTWTCAPYQLPDRPGFGEHVAWGESNAIVFANSVLGARTNRYCDFGSRRRRASWRTTCSIRCWGSCSGGVPPGGWSPWRAWIQGPRRGG